jgi:hypothetical protein
VKTQAAMEFLITYGFLFILLAIFLTAVFAIAFPATSVYQKSECGSLGNLGCLQGYLYTSQQYGYSAVQLLLSNSNPIPVNVTNISIVTSQNQTGIGACSPNLVYPGGTTSCLIEFSAAESQGAAVSGSYKASVQYCNSGINSVQRSACSYTPVNYSGYFTLYATSRNESLFSVIAMHGPASEQLPAFSEIRLVPTLPENYTIMQNGYWVSSYLFGSNGYAFTTNSSNLGSYYLDHPATSYTITTSSLNSSNVACNSPYNSTLSIAYTDIYVPEPSTPVTMQVEGQSAIMAYYRPLLAKGSGWISPFASGSTWGATQSTKYASANAVLNSGIYELAVLWTDACGPGTQAFSFT